jgi:hypothetical protein
LFIELPTVVLPNAAEVKKRLDTVDELIEFSKPMGFPVIIKLDSG